ncbi:hypothetical protein [Isoptericola sp. NPDC055881]
MDRRDTSIDGYRFVGRGPSATGPGPGWTMRPDLYARCMRCEDLLGLDPSADATCRCGRLYKDTSYGRFGSADGDDDIAIFIAT